MNCKTDIADALDELGRFAEAVPLRQEVFDSYRHHFGEADSGTLNVQSSFVVDLYRSGDRDAARTLAEMMRNVGQRHRGTEDRYTVWAEDFLAQTNTRTSDVRHGPILSVSSSRAARNRGTPRTASTGTARITSRKPRSRGTDGQPSG